MHVKNLTHGKRSDRVTVLVWDLPEEDPETGIQGEGIGEGTGDAQGKVATCVCKWTLILPENSGSRVENTP